jgi:predicted unusual protein kinase regulating ubiquinone biosynthesis (AarF/ABC1/UbiB family)
MVEAERHRIRRLLDAVELEHGEEPALTHACREAEVLETDPSLHGQLHAFLYACAALDRHARRGGLDSETVGRLYRRALTVLAKNGIRPATSRVAHLYGELHATMCRVAALEGRAWSAAWRHFLAKYEGGSTPDQRELLRRVSLDLQLGLARDALARLLDAELPGTPVLALASLRLARVRILRLSGELEHAAQVHGTISVDRECAPATSRELAWEKACIESQQSGSLEPQVRLIRVDRDARTPRRLLDLFLWSRATPAKTWLGAAPKAASLRRMAAAELDPVALRAALAIERCIEGKSSIGSRVHALGRALEQADRIDELDQQLLVWAAAGRWLFRVKRHDLAALPLARYRALSLGLSQGKQPDILGVASDVPLDEATACSFDEFRFPEAVAAPPTSFAGRQLALSSMAFAMARAGAGNLVNRALSGGSAQREHLIEYAEIASRYMGQLKGPIMKIGQLLSYYGFDLPDEVTLAFATLQDSAARIPFDRVRTTLEQELDQPLASAFAGFEERPLATGSLGQVHAAKLHDGRRVAVKVQYPDAERMIEHDLANLSLAKPFLRALLPRWQIGELLRELGERMLEECDYRREAENQRYFRHLLVGDPSVHVPEPILERTTRRVLTSELVCGLSFAEFCERATQAEKNQAGVTVFRFVMRTAMSERSFNSDMHPGNLLFSKGRVHFLDFGNVRHWRGPDEGRGFQTIVEAVLSGNRESFGAALLELGLVARDQPFDFEWAFELMVTRALRCLVEERPMRFEADAVRRDIEMFFLDHPEAQKLLVPPRYLYGFRIYWGMFAVLSALGAEACWRTIAEEALRSARAEPA